MAGQLTIDTLKASSGVLATQNGMTGIAKAWVNFNGTNGAINGSFNVSSVTYSTTGCYIVNFTTAMADINYNPVLSTRLQNATNPFTVSEQSTVFATRTTSALYVGVTVLGTYAYANAPSVYVAVLGN